MKVLKLTKSSIISDLKNGLTKKEIAKKHGISYQVLNEAIKNAGLSHLRASKKTVVEIVDDEEDNYNGPCVYQKLDSEVDETHY